MSSQKLDIPMVRDIPILSQLAKLDKKNMKVDKKVKSKEMTDTVMEADDLEVETHFVENPFIKTRERANRKDLAS